MRLKERNDGRARRRALSGAGAVDRTDSLGVEAATMQRGQPVSRLHLMATNSLRAVSCGAVPTSLWRSVRGAESASHGAKGRMAR